MATLSFYDFNGSDMRALKQYNTGDEAVDNALDRIHSLTLRGPDDWNISGQDFDDWLVEMIRAMERLPERHPVRSCCYRLYTAGSHWRWEPSRTAEFYEKFTTELYPLLDSVEINPPTIDRKPDPVLQKWRDRIAQAEDSTSRLHLCIEIANSDHSPWMLKDAARKAASVLRTYEKRKRLNDREYRLIESAFYSVRMNLK